MHSWIDNIILGLKDFNDTNNIYELYKELNISIRKLDSNNILLQGNEAFYTRSFFGEEITFIKNNLCEPYEKFILAHELGHALLHPNIYEAAFNKSLINVGKLEKQANYFAFKILNIELDPVEFEGFTIDQIASSLDLPTKFLSCVT